MNQSTQYQQRLMEALALRKTNKFKQSNELLLALGKEFPESAEINYQLAWSFDVMGLEKQAIHYYVKAIAYGLSAIDEPEAYIGLGSTYRALGKYEDAYATLIEANKKYPDNGGIQLFLAMTLYNLQEYHQSTVLLIQLLLDTSSDATIGDYSKAIAAYAKDLDKIG